MQVIWTLNCQSPDGAHKRSSPALRHTQTLLGSARRQGSEHFSPVQLESCPAPTLAIRGFSSPSEALSSWPLSDLGILRSLGPHADLSPSSDDAALSHLECCGRLNVL